MSRPDSVEHQCDCGETDWFWIPPDSNPTQVINDIMHTEGAGASFYEDGQCQARSTKGHRK